MNVIFNSGNKRIPGGVKTCGGVFDEGVGRGADEHGLEALLEKLIDGGNPSDDGVGLNVDSLALAEALERGVISGAAVDVLDTEPPAPDNPLIGARNVTVTPHIAWATVEARQRLMRVAAENVRAWLSGRPINRVN